MIRRAQGRTDRNGRDGDAGVAGDDVSGRIAGAAERARSYLWENAQAFHSDRSRRQGGGGAFPLRFDQGADHLSREMSRSSRREPGKNVKTVSALKRRVSFL